MMAGCLLCIEVPVILNILRPLDFLDFRVAESLTNGGGS